jgi:hypothetical protein
MSKEKKPGFLRRLFGGKPAADAPSRKATEKTAEVRNRKVEAASAAVPPPAGPAAPPGVRAPDERKPGTRKKGTPEDRPGPQGRVEGSKPGTGAQPDKAVPRQTSRLVPPPHAPYPIPANKPDEHEAEKPTAPASERHEPNDS